MCIHQGSSVFSWQLHPHSLSNSYRWQIASLPVVSYAGSNIMSVIGSNVLQCLPRNLWAGLVPIPSVDVFGQSNSA